MLLTILRHGQARRPEDGRLHDDARILSATGREAARATAAALAGRGVQPTHVYSSPLVRAIQTAELVAAGLGYAGEIDLWGCLEPDGSIGELLARLGEHADADDIVLVSHEPLCSGLATALGGIVVHGVGTADAVRLRSSEAGEGAGTLLFRWQSASGRFFA